MGQTCLRNSQKIILILRIQYLHRNQSKVDTMESTNLIFDVNNSKKSLIATKHNLESIMIMDAISSISSMFVFGSWESFDVDSSSYAFEDVVYWQPMWLRRLWGSREDPFYGLTPSEIKQKYKFFLHFS